MFGLFCVLVFGVPQLASAAEVTAAEVESWTPGQYNDWMVGQQVAVAQQLLSRASVVRASPTREALEAFRVDTIHLLKEQSAVTASLPPYQGDTVLRDAAAKAFDDTIAFYEGDLAELYQLLARAPRPGDLERVEAIFAGARALSKRIGDEVSAAQKGYAERHSMILVEREAAPVALAEPEPFVAPGVPPEGVSLPSNLYMVMTLNWGNAHIEATNGVILSINASFEAEETAQVEACKTLEAAVKAARAELAPLVPEWQGDGALYEAAEQVLEAGELVAKSQRELLKLRPKATKQKDIDRVNAQIREMNAAVQSALGNFQGVDQAWKQRSSVDAFIVYSQARIGGPTRQAPEEEPAPTGTSSAAKQVE